MRRFLMGAVWFVALYVGTMMLIGGILGAMAGVAAAPPDGHFAQGLRAGYAAGEQAGTAFRETWGGLIFLAALATATVGSYGGWLPGTRPRNADRALPAARPA